MSLFTMRRMRNLDKDYRIQANSLPEIQRELERVKALFQDVKVNGRKMQIGPFVNAILAYFLDLPTEEQEKAVREGASKVDRLLEAEDMKGAWRKGDEGLMHDAPKVEIVDIPIPVKRRARK